MQKIINKCVPSCVLEKVTEYSVIPLLLVRHQYPNEPSKFINSRVQITVIVQKKVCDENLEEIVSPVRTSNVVVGG